MKESCSQHLAQQGKAYPRTCLECGLGPCKYQTGINIHVISYLPAGYEEKRAEFESRRKEFMDAYFRARPEIIATSDRMRMFEAGFERAWNFLQESKL